MSEEHVLEINFCVKLLQSCTTVPRWKTLDAALTAGQMVVYVGGHHTHTHARAHAHTRTHGLHCPHCKISLQAPKSQRQTSLE